MFTNIVLMWAKLIKKKQITKSGFKTKNEAYIAGQKVYDEFMNGESNEQCNMMYSEYLDYLMKEYFQINYKLVEYKIVNSRKNEIQMVFTRKDGKYSGIDIIKYPYKIIHQELGIKCKFYDLRGSFATISLRNGCEIKDIAEVLGHKRIETTEKYYISSTFEDKKKVNEEFEKVIKYH